MMASTEVTFGKHAVRAVFQARPEAIRRVVLLEGARRYLEEFEVAARKLAIVPEIFPRGNFLRVGNLGKEDKHQGVFVLAARRTLHDEKDLETLHKGVVLALDQVSNPRSLGTILRGAAYFGAQAVLVMKNRSATLSPAAVSVAVGGADFVRIHRITNLARSLQILKDRGFWVYALDGRGDRTLAQTEFGDKIVIVVGAEGEGLRVQTKRMCDELIRIPGGRPGLDSLNVGVAATVALAELFRQQTHGADVRSSRRKG